MKIAEKIISEFNKLDFSKLEEEKIGKYSAKFSVGNETFSTVIKIKNHPTEYQFNLNLKDRVNINDIFKELGSYSNLYSFRDDLTELKFDKKFGDSTVSILIDGKVSEISNDGIKIKNPKGEEKTYSPYFVDCLTIYLS